MPIQYRTYSYLIHNFLNTYMVTKPWILCHLLSDVHTTTTQPPPSRLQKPVHFCCLFSNVHIPTTQKISFHPLYATYLVLLYILLLYTPSELIKIHIIHQTNTFLTHHVYVGQTWKVSQVRVGSIWKIHGCMVSDNLESANWGTRISSPPQ